MPPENENTNNQDGARFRQVSCADIREWVRKAQPGARMTYGRGWHLSGACSEEVAEFVVRLHKMGFATYHQNGADRTFQGIAYLLMRSAKRLTLKDEVR